MDEHEFIPVGTYNDKQKQKSIMLLMTEIEDIHAVLVDTDETISKYDTIFDESIREMADIRNNQLSVASGLLAGTVIGTCVGTVYGAIPAVFIGGLGGTITTRIVKK